MQVSDELHATLREVYRHDPSGGSLHFMLEDGNLEDGWFEDGYKPMPDVTPNQEIAERRAFGLLAAMTEAGRNDAVKRFKRDV